MEILGEIRETDAVACLFRVAEGSVDEDAPAYWLRRMAISSPGETGTAGALEGLRRMTAQS
ncbi:hypothetical protein ACIO3R_19835 [Streptomyces sp. NPDC087428]|uniref:hypothetical protein n=1 Tax=Streptomyces sp. NPDC087428 TaxID=3365788 RepID=UPI0037FB4814